MARHEATEGPRSDIMEDSVELTVPELCRACRLSAERVFELVAEGIIDPVGRDPGHYRFRAVAVHRVRRVQRLEQDLGVNVAGAAVVLDLLDELERLRRRLHRLESRD